MFCIRLALQIWKDVHVLIQPKNRTFSANSCKKVEIVQNLKLNVNQKSTLYFGMQL